MELSLSDFASIAEVVGALAVVISLIYVGMQVQDSTRAVRSATANETTNAISAWYENIAVDPETVQLLYAGASDPDSLTAEQWLQLVYLLHGLVLKYQTAFYLAREGTLDSNISRSITGTISGNRESPGFLRYWEQRGSLFEPEFKAYIEDILVNGTTNTDLEAAYRRVRD
jgi:hypothetical protein